MQLERGGRHQEGGAELHLWRNAGRAIIDLNSALLALLNKCRGFFAAESQCLGRGVKVTRGSGGGDSPGPSWFTHSLGG